VDKIFLQLEELNLEALPRRRQPPKGSLSCIKYTPPQSD
jgi:hypothetical protein